MALSTLRLPIVLVICTRVNVKCLCSLVESEHPVREAHPEGCDTSHAPETSVVAGGPSEQLLVSAVAEGCIGGELAVAQFEVARLTHIEGNWAATSNDPLALAIAEW